MIYETRITLNYYHQGWVYGWVKIIYESGTSASYPITVHIDNGDFTDSITLHRVVGGDDGIGIDGDDGSTISYLYASNSSKLVPVSSDAILRAALPAPPNTVYAPSILL